jgi:hypothetical protein
MKKILFIQLTGGLGNQLFQVSNAMSLYKALNKPVIIWIYSGNSKIYKAHEKVRLQDMGIKGVCISGLMGIWLRRFLKLGAFIGIVYRVCDNNSQVEINNKMIYFAQGLYQYLPSLSVRRFFSIRMKLRSYNFLYSVLHVRLGDYTTKYSKNIIGLLDPSYYTKSLEILHKLNMPIYIVTDGEEQQINLLLGNTKIQYKIKKGLDDLDDLSFISNASAIAMSNSTFSLWGGYLLKDSYVLAPRDWFPTLQCSQKEIKNPRFMNEWRIL